MSKVSQGKKQHRSMRGKTVDMDLLRKRNELTPAVGNAKVNARGDELGPGGQIVKKREDVVQDFYAQAGQVAHSDGVVQAQKVQNTTVPEKPVNRKSTSKGKAKTSSSKTVEKSQSVDVELTKDERDLLDQTNNEDLWIEDASGNFVSKDT